MGAEAYPLADRPGKQHLNMTAITCAETFEVDFFYDLVRGLTR